MDAGVAVDVGIGSRVAERPNKDYARGRSPELTKVVCAIAERTRDGERDFPAARKVDNSTGAAGARIGAGRAVAEANNRPPGDE